MILIYSSINTQFMQLPTIQQIYIIVPDVPVPYVPCFAFSANILLDKHYNAKLGDFGLARQLACISDGRTLVTAPVFAKSLGYFPPEFHDWNVFGCTYTAPCHYNCNLCTITLPSANRGHWQLPKGCSHSYDS